MLAIWELSTIRDLLAIWPNIVSIARTWFADEACAPSWPAQPSRLCLLEASRSIWILYPVYPRGGLWASKKVRSGFTWASHRSRDVQAVASPDRLSLFGASPRSSSSSPPWIPFPTFCDVHWSHSLNYWSQLLEILWLVTVYHHPHVQHDLVPFTTSADSGPRLRRWILGAI